LWSFRVYYNKPFASEADPTLRFAKALIASCQPIRDRRLVYEWNRRQLERHRRRSGTRRERKKEQHAHAEALST
jgi:transposase-like protein